jgi:hypothetical protein
VLRAFFTALAAWVTFKRAGVLTCPASVIFGQYHAA